ACGRVAVLANRGTDDQRLSLVAGVGHVGSGYIAGLRPGVPVLVLLRSSDHAGISSRATSRGGSGVDGYRAGTCTTLPVKSSMRALSICEVSLLEPDLHSALELDRDFDELYSRVAPRIGPG